MKLFIRVYFIVFFILTTLLFIDHFYLSKFPQEIEYSSLTTFKPKSSLTSASTIIPKSTLSPSPRPIVRLPTDTPEPWGIARQIDEHTWTMKIGEDPNMAIPGEILSALNEYRPRYGSQILTLDPKLTAYAQSRVDYFYQNKTIDSHTGFNNFLENEDGFNKLGFTYLGENISYGYRLNGVHLIEWLYAGDEPHNKNQLDSKWDHVGIAVKGTATCLIFATGKM